jgi:hypothetical protein
MIATITCIDDPDITFKGRLANLSAHGISLIIPTELAAGVMVKVEWGESSFLGQLIYCEPKGSEFRAGLKVEDPIYDATIDRNDEKNPNSLA